MPAEVDELYQKTLARGKGQIVPEPVAQRRRTSCGERWQADGVESLTPGEMVEVAGIKDLTLVVRRRMARTVSEGGKQQ